VRSELVRSAFLTREIFCAGFHDINCHKMVLKSDFKPCTHASVEPNGLFMFSFFEFSRGVLGRLTEHGVELLQVEVPLPPGRLVTLGLGVVGVVELGLCPERIQHPQHAPVTAHKGEEF